MEVQNKRMNNLNSIKYENPVKFIIAEKWLTITVIGSIFTFQFLTSFKIDIVDPLMDTMIPPDLFDYINISLEKENPYI